MWGTIHTRLHLACIELFQYEQDCRTLLSDAGIDTRHISFAEPNAFRWENIIRECHKQRSLHKLVPVLLERYADNEVLQEAVEPWIHGRPKGLDMGKKKESITTVSDSSGVVELTAPATIIVSTPDQAQAKVVVPEPEPEPEPELVPVLVPREFVEKAQQALVQTVDSLRLTILEHEKKILELSAWREQLSKLSRPEVASQTGGNES